jgi:hypothetical protein
MDQVKHLREQAEKCFRLAQDVRSEESRIQLEVFGHDFQKRADGMDDRKTASTPEKRGHHPR